MARYELKGEFFWTIEQIGSTLKTTIGKIGTDAEITVKTYANAREASGEYDRLVLEKLGQGYAEMGNVTLPGSPKAKRTKAVTAKPRGTAKKKVKS
jgi:predicted DNA-binding WGR domain protein